MIPDILKACRDIFIIILLSSCAGENVQREVLNFPADISQPFLTLENILGEDTGTKEGFLQSLSSILKGPSLIITPSRPVSVAIDEQDNVYVVDSDAARILFYENREGSIQQAVSMDINGLFRPQGIAIHQDVIFISDSETGLIHKYDFELKTLGILQLPDLSHPGQLRVNVFTGDLFIVDTQGQQIVVTSPKGVIKVRLNNMFFGKNLLRAPLDVAFTAEGNIVILDGLTRRIEILSSDYQHLGGFGDYDNVPGSFSYPRGLAISSDGFIFVSDAAFGNVQIFNSEGALLFFWGENGRAAGQFLLPSVLTFDSRDNLYIVDQYNNRVQVFHYIAQGS